MPECPVGSNTACYKFIDDEKTKMTVTINGNDIALEKKGDKWAPKTERASSSIGNTFRRGLNSIGLGSANREGEAAARANAPGIPNDANAANGDVPGDLNTAVPAPGEGTSAAPDQDNGQAEAKPERVDENGSGGARRKRRSNKRKPKKSAKKPKRSKKGKTRKQKK